MATPAFPLLDQADEDALHFTRMLTIEERPFLRVSKRLTGAHSMIRSFPKQLPTPPPDGEHFEEKQAEAEATLQRQEQERRQWRDDVLLDFKALESVLVRIQFLKDSNERERSRYATEKNKILETAQAVRDNTAELRVQLEEAQKMLALRKTYDELTEKITSNRLLKPRDEQHSALEKLNAEIADLEQEGADYATTWADRKMQFGRISEEGKQMMRLIRGEKDDQDKDEGMEDADDREDGEASTTKGGSSQVGTPKPDTGDGTPLRGGLEADEHMSQGQNKLLQRAMGLGSATPLLGSSRTTSPAPGEGDGPTPAAGKDTDMVGAEATMAQGVPVSDDLEEGEAEDSAVEGEQMDVT